MGILMEYIGNLQKMEVSLADPTQYWLLLGNNRILLNNYLGKNISIKYTGLINCIGCGKTIKKSYQQGYCFPCTQTLARCDICILKPELCHHHKGTCRGADWAEKHCFMPHIVYLANSSGVKVGITRELQIPTRWIDQGAVQALPIVRTKSRYQSGLIEIAFAKFVQDKTNWRKMLQGIVDPSNLEKIRDELFHQNITQLHAIAAQFDFGDLELLTAEQIITISYPVLEYPKKVIALKFDNTHEITGILLGIKGQYLLLDKGVLNIRNHAGYAVKFA